MTWYWWTHWFWITSVIGLLNGFPLAGLDPSESVKMRPVPNDRHLSSRGEPLHFPIAVQSDEDDVFDGHAGSITIEEAHLSDDWMAPSPPKRSQINTPVIKTTTTIAHLVVVESSPPSPRETTPVYSEQHIITARLNTRSNEIIGSSTTPRLYGLLTNNATTLAMPISNTSSKHYQPPFPPGVSASPNVIADATNYTSHNSTAPLADDPPPPAHPDDERHNYTNELLMPGAKLADATIEKPQRQSKTLSAGQQQRLAINDAKSEDNFTAESKNLLTAVSAAVSVSADDVLSERELSVGGQTTSSSLNAGSISGICVAGLVLCGVVSSAAFLGYRRRYLNKPQALSEPDSTGYIDDSTIRDNSDEMYSLDNDSFLNSLEAMTIQNYWTENVKHTKL